MSTALRRHRSWWARAAACALLLTACQEQPTELEQVEPGLPDLRAALLDAAHDPRYPRLYFLPPMVKQPTFTGTFDASVYAQLRVTICRWNGSTCAGAPVATFVAGNGQSALRMSDESYHANWEVRAPATLGAHRLTVMAGAQMIGGADIMVVNKPQELQSVAATDIGVVHGRTLPIRFRVEVADAHADLSIAAVTAPSSVASGGLLNVSATIKNSGDAPAAPTNVRFRVLAAGTGAEIASTTLAQASIEAGGTFDVSAAFSTAASWPASVVIEVTTDVGGAVAEASESNNSALSAPIEITSADLVISAVDVSTNTVVLRCALTVQITIRNAGTGLAPATDLRVVLRDPAGIVFASTTLAQTALHAGGLATLNASFTAASTWPAEFTVLAETDVGATVGEADETNNTAANTGGAVQTRLTVPAGFDRMWICGSNTSWTDGVNWEPAGAPTAAHHVYIPAGVPRYPILAANTAVSNLTIENGARLDVASFTLTSTGNVVSGLMVGTGTLSMTGAPRTLRGTVPALSINGMIALSGNTSANSAFINVARSLNLNGSALQVTGSFTVASTTSTIDHLVMTSASDRLVVGGTMSVGGATQLDAGAIHLRGHFIQTGAVNSLTPTGTRFVFDGNTAQSVSFANAANSFFADVDMRAPAAVNFTNDVRVTRQLVVFAGAQLTQSVGETFYTTRVPEEQAAGAYRVATSVIDGTVIMDRNITLASPSANFLVNPAKSLNLNGFALVLAGGFAVPATISAIKHLVMATGDPLLEVGRTMALGGATQLDVGTVVLRGNFVQNGAANSLTPTGTRFVFQGSAPQSVTFGNVFSSFFGDVDVRAPATVNFTTDVRVTRQLVVASGALLTQSVGETFYTTRVPEEQASGVYRVPTSVIDGTVIMDRNITLASPSANFLVNPAKSLNLNGFALVLAGGFAIPATISAIKHLVMATGDPLLDIGGTMAVGGATQLDVGTVVLRGNFVQNGAANAFTPVGTRFVFQGASLQTVKFANPTTSSFRSVEIRGGATVSLLTVARVRANLDLDGTLSVPAGITLIVNGTLFFGGALSNNGTVTVASCVNEGGTFSGSGNNPCM